MKIQQRLIRHSEKTGDPFYKYMINISHDVMNDLGWKKGTELKTKVSGGKLILEKE